MSDRDFAAEIRNEADCRCEWCRAIGYHEREMERSKVLIVELTNMLEAYHELGGLARQGHVHRPGKPCQGVELERYPPCSLAQKAYHLLDQYDEMHMRLAANGVSASEWSE